MVRRSLLAGLVLTAVAAFSPASMAQEAEQAPQETPEPKGVGHRLLFLPAQSRSGPAERGPRPGAHRPGPGRGLGAGAQIGILSADAGVSPAELLNLLGGFLLIDFRNDDF